MFAKNDYIIYGTTGVCKITGIEKKKFNNMEREYYILKPAYDPNSTIYAPVDNNILLLEVFLPYAPLVHELPLILYFASVFVIVHKLLL